jgi:transposase
MKIPRFLQFEGYETLDMKEFLSQGYIEVPLEKKADKEWKCWRCGSELGAQRGRYPVRVRGLSILRYRVVIRFFRYKGHCPKCKKARAEAVSFLSTESPHLTQDFSDFIGGLCEIAPVARVAEIFGLNELTTWRIDFRRLKKLLSKYPIPKVTAISVDEVYARKKSKFKNESRNRRFFTVISDLNTHKVIWVSESRDTESLDQFYILLGEEACKEITVVAMDQHEDYAKSTKKYCPNATVVWDRFHIMQNFEKAVNEQRMQLHGEQEKGSDLSRLTRGKYRFMFLKKAKSRTEEERQHIDEVMKINERFAKLELIKERMVTFFDEKDEKSARVVFDEIGDWIWQAGFELLKNWHRNLEAGWTTLKSYFVYRVTSALSEGINNVIKALKRRAFGYKNMYYFRLKIMQVCGYLNSRYVTMSNQIDALKS